MLECRIINKLLLLDIENNLDNFRIMVVEAKENHPKLNILIPRSKIYDFVEILRSNFTLCLLFNLCTLSYFIRAVFLSIHLVNWLHFHDCSYYTHFCFNQLYHGVIYMHKFIKIFCHGYQQKGQTYQYYCLFYISSCTDYRYHNNCCCEK